MCSRILTILAAMHFSGCVTVNKYDSQATRESSKAKQTQEVSLESSVAQAGQAQDVGNDEETKISLTAFEEQGEGTAATSNPQEVQTELPPLEMPAEVTPLPIEIQEPATEDTTVSLDSVIGSVYQSFPLLESAFAGRIIAQGDQISAAGAYDFKFKAASENNVLGFYQNYRQSLGFAQPLYNGGEFFAGYRVGNGEFQPWYLERQTNEGGEFKAGVNIPLAKDRRIDQRRAELWRANYSRQMAEPEIHALLIAFIQEASYAYWEWVAAGEKLLIAEQVLVLAQERTDRIKQQVENGFIDPPELTDNLRLVSEREAKLAEVFQKYQKAAIKLSLYLRDYEGNPIILGKNELQRFPSPDERFHAIVDLDIQMAISNRPELVVMDFLRKQLQLDYSAAQNETRPSIDTQWIASQDIGMPTSPKNDKGEFELEASVFMDVPLQRRKARGKMFALEGKMTQLQAKRRMTEDKIAVEVQTVHTALQAALKRYDSTQQAVEYAEDLAQRERRNFELGSSDLLKVTLREQYAVEASEKVIDSLLDFYKAEADYRATLAQDQLP
ncbi:TolC family protein [uncultured Rubinisphaera sp.]|uniref:TolC family protein n=1 Tax=uncultured Rubinisphaera sp. TaxID=1678686 RepID=UPI0030D8BB45